MIREILHDAGIQVTQGTLDLMLAAIREIIHNSRGHYVTLADVAENVKELFQ